MYPPLIVSFPLYTEMGHSSRDSEASFSPRADRPPQDLLPHSQSIVVAFQERCCYRSFDASWHRDISLPTPATQADDAHFSVAVWHEVYPAYLRDVFHAPPVSGGADRRPRPFEASMRTIAAPHVRPRAVVTRPLVTGTNSLRAMIFGRRGHERILHPVLLLFLLPPLDLRLLPTPGGERVDGREWDLHGDSLAHAVVLEPRPRRDTRRSSTAEEGVTRGNTASAPYPGLPA